MSGPASRRELMRLHVDALFTRDAAGDLLRVNEPNGAPAPRCFIGRTADGSILRFRHDVPEAMRRELAALVGTDAVAASHADAPIDPAPYATVLHRSAPVVRTWSGPAFAFPPVLPGSGEAIPVSDANADVLQPLLHEWMPDVGTNQPMFALVLEGRAVAVCCSVRRTEEAHEVGVETVPAWRGHGYAARVTSAWAAAVRQMGNVPLYSTSWQNAASRTVARKLGLICFGSDLHIT